MNTSNQDYTTKHKPILSERKRRAYALAEQAVMRYNGHDTCRIFGNFTVADLLLIAGRYNMAYAYRLETGDEVGSHFLVIGWTRQQVESRPGAPRQDEQARALETHAANLARRGELELIEAEL